MRTKLVMAALVVAPIEPDNLGRTAGEIQVSAVPAKARFFGPRDVYRRSDPVFAVADHDVLSLLLAAHRRDGAVDIVLDVHDTGLPLGLVADRRLPHTEKLPDQNRQQMRGAAHATGENAREAFNRHGGGRVRGTTCLLYT